MLGMPAAGGNFVNLKSQNDDFPLESCISKVDRLQISGE